MIYPHSILLIQIIPAHDYPKELGKTMAPNVFLEMVSLKQPIHFPDAPNVRNIYLHLGYIWGKCRYIFHTYSLT